MIVEIISVLVTLIVFAIGFYVSMPAINFHSKAFCSMFVVLLIIFILVWNLLSFIKRRSINKRVNQILALVTVIFILFVGLATFISGPVFRSGTYSSRITVKDGEFDKDVPELTDIGNIPLMDTASAKKLGDRVVGSLSDVVSQYQIADDYTTICYKGQVMKIAPLEYAGFIKYMNNKSEGIPGYVLVNPKTNEAEFVRLDNKIKYSPSAYFSNYLLRKIRFSYPTKMIDQYNFQIDDNGTPYWVITCIEKQTFFGAEKPNEVILLNASTGESEIYPVEKAPEWVDYIFDGDTVEELYNSYGKLSNGYINSVFGQKGCTMTTDDFGYVIKDDDVYVYTGITSTVSDESNLGFILVNSRTGDFKYYKVSGAEEYSAMSAAEGVVQNYGYSASFPSLINIDSEPTYAMVLKDNNGLVKLYSMVNVKNYTIVATGETLSETLKNYSAALKSAGKQVDVEDVKDDTTKEATFVISDIQFIVNDGNTTCYIKDEQNKCYKQDFADNEDLILLKVNDNITVKYDEGKEKDSIIEISSVKVN